MSVSEATQNVQTERSSCE